MVAKSASLAILTTYEGTVFFVRDGTDTLFFSKPYFGNMRPLPAIYSFFLIAMGAIPFSELQLPMVDRVWWDAVLPSPFIPYESGIVSQ